MNDLVEEYGLMIHKMTHMFTSYPYKEDLYQAGFIGLMDAKEKYDKNYGTKFSTFAYPFILGEMKKVVRKDTNIKISRSILSLKLKIEKMTLLLSQQLMRYPTIHEIASELKMEDEKIEEILSINTNVSSLDETITGDTNEMSFYEIIENNSLNLDTLVALKEEISNLKEPDKTIIEKRFIENYSQTEVANLLGMNQVKVSRIENKVKQKLRNNLVN